MTPGGARADRAGADGAADVVVVGGGVAGLTVAHTLAGRGVRPLVLEAADAVGGLVTAGVVGGLEIDLGAEAFATRRPEVAALARSLGLDVEEPAGGSWVWTPGHPFRIPARSLLGIPAEPGAADVVAAIGPGAARAAAGLDARLPAEVGADAADLATLVRTRMGAEVLARLVTPVAGGIHSADPGDLAVDAVAPGLRAALAAEGTLAGAVLALLARSPGAPAATTAGGLFRLPRALAAAVAAAGGEVRTGRAVTSLRTDGAGWALTVRAPDGTTTVRAPRVVLALPGPAAHELLAGVVALPPAPPAKTSAITHVTLVVRAHGLDAAPRGAGLLVPPGGGVRAKALTHTTAKWPTLGATAGPGVHVLRVSYGRPGEDTADVDAALATAEAEALLGVPLGEVLDHRVVRRTGALSAPTPAHRAHVGEVVDVLGGLPGLDVAGAWVAGTGLAAVVAHAQDLASR